MLGGEFGGVAVLDDDLTPRQVPKPGTGWQQVSTFALTFDGYAYRGHGLGSWANEHVRAFSRDGTLDRDLSLRDLRALLFYEQRRFHHFGTAPAPDDEPYTCALLIGICDAVVRRQAELAAAAPLPEYDPDDDGLRDVWLKVMSEAADRKAAGLPEPPPRPRPTPPEGPGWVNGLNLERARLAPGMRVFHQRSGIGEVLAVHPGRGPAELRVRFESGGTYWYPAVLLQIEVEDDSRDVQA